DHRRRSAGRRAQRRREGSLSQVSRARTQGAVRGGSARDRRLSLIARRARPSSMLVLGIETSCDETAASVVEDGRWVRSDVVSSQIKVHAVYGGVVPEVASRQHVATIVPVLRRAASEAGIALGDLDGIAVTAG